MPRYLVRWEIDIFDADTPQDAALRALDIQRDRWGQATHFSVAEVDDEGMQDGKYPPQKFVELDAENYMNWDEEPDNA